MKAGSHCLPHALTSLLPLSIVVRREVMPGASLDQRADEEMVRTKAVALAALVVGAGGLLGCDEQATRRVGASASEPSVVLDGVTWREVLHWDFRDGLYPRGWSWGRWGLVDGMLEGRDPEGKIAVYFLPFHHGGDFILETKVRLLEGVGDKAVDVQLLTRDSRRLDFESGMNLYDAGNTVTVRHMAKKVNHVWENFPGPVELGGGAPHVMRFVVYRGAVTAYLDGATVFRSSGTYPVGSYGEPHLAVESGVGRFEYVKIYEPQ